MQLIITVRSPIPSAIRLIWQVMIMRVCVHYGQYAEIRIDHCSKITTVIGRDPSHLISPDNALIIHGSVCEYNLMAWR